jgi:hypothetical protein
MITSAPRTAYTADRKTEKIERPDASQHTVRRKLCTQKSRSTTKNAQRRPMTQIETADTTP